MTPPTFREVGIISFLFYTRDKETWSILVYKRFLQSHVPNNVPNDVPNFVLQMFLTFITYTYFAACFFMLFPIVSNGPFTCIPYIQPICFAKCSLHCSHISQASHLYCSQIDSPTFDPIFLPQIPTLCSLHKVCQMERI